MLRPDLLHSGAWSHLSCSLSDHPLLLNGTVSRGHIVMLLAAWECQSTPQTHARGTRLAEICSILKPSVCASESWQ